MPPDKPADAETYVATEPLYLSTPGSGVVPQLARRAGQPVTARALAKHPEWRGKVRRVVPEPSAPPSQAPARRGASKGA
jgi:hypothetical protein